MTAYVVVGVESNIFYLMWHNCTAQIEIWMIFEIIVAYGFCLQAILYFDLRWNKLHKISFLHEVKRFITFDKKKRKSNVLLNKYINTVFHKRFNFSYIVIIIKIINFKTFFLTRVLRFFENYIYTLWLWLKKHFLSGHGTSIVRGNHPVSWPKREVSACFKQLKSRDINTEARVC